MKIVFSGLALPNTGVLVVGVLEGAKLTTSARQLDRKLKGALVRAIKVGRFKGKKDQNLSILAPAGTGFDRIHLVGLGKPEEIGARRAQSAGGGIYAALGSAGHATVSVAVDAIEKCQLVPAVMAAELAFGARLRSYRFDKYRTKEEKEKKPSLKTLRILCAGAVKARIAFARKDNVAEGVFLARDLVSEPANVIYPQTMAAQARALGKLGVTVKVLGEARMKRLGMGALLAVGQGSARESKLVTMEWNGAPRSRRGKKTGPVAFVGKGVTFDSGGLSLKPAGSMEEMKYDMGGAATVIGVMKALAGRKARVHAVGVIGLVENMPSGEAQRPGDVVVSMSGQTIEVLNTDAEGRLVLADALWYCKKTFKPRFMVDLATLTGAIVICLGSERAGLFSNNDKLAEHIAAAGEKVGEPVWRMPMGPEYDKKLKSDIADMKNIGNRGAGSITAAQFLQRFVDKAPWAHLDIAGVTWTKTGAATTPKGGTGFGVRLLDRLVAEHYEGR